MDDAQLLAEGCCLESLSKPVKLMHILRHLNPEADISLVHPDTGQGLSIHILPELSEIGQEPFQTLFQAEVSHCRQGEAGLELVVENIRPEILEECARIYENHYGMAQTL